jgi:hypothetical protein
MKESHLIVTHFDSARSYERRTVDILNRYKPRGGQRSCRKNRTKLVNVYTYRTAVQKNSERQRTRQEKKLAATDGTNLDAALKQA